MYHKTLLSDSAVTGPMTQSVNCMKCGSDKMAEQSISIAFWAGKEPCLIRGIPALVCEACGEEFISDETAMGLDMMRGNGFRREDAADFIQVPVYSFTASSGPVK